MNHLSPESKPLPLPLSSINNAMQTCLCQLNLFSNFPQGERVPLTLSSCLPSITLQLYVLFLLSFLSVLPCVPSSQLCICLFFPSVEISASELSLSSYSMCQIGDTGEEEWRRILLEIFSLFQIIVLALRHIYCMV